MEGEGKNKTKQPMLIVIKPGTEQVITNHVKHIKHNTHTKNVR